jgi:hypothetical protein
MSEAIFLQVNKQLFFIHRTMYMCHTLILIHAILIFLIRFYPFAIILHFLKKVNKSQLLTQKVNLYIKTHIFIFFAY